MSVINTQPLAGASGSQATGYNLTNSLRFRGSANAYLNRTPSATATSSQKFTISFWVKLGLKITSSEAWLFDCYNQNFGLYFNSNSAMPIQLAGGAGYLVPTQVFRDPAAWYHIVIAVDTTQATASNRIRYYVNGSEVTSFSTANYPSQNTSYNWNSSGNAQYIGTNSAVTARSFDGYIAEFNSIDGQQLTPSSFGENNADTGVWQPKKYTGTYGTNGFYLPFTSNSNSTYAGSFNSSNYLTTASNSALALGTGDFTVEFWANPSSAPSVAGFVDIATSNTTGRFVIDYLSGNVCVETAGVTLITGSTSLPLNQWSHIAVSRSGTTMSLFQNGIRIGTTTNSTNFSQSVANIGINVGPAYGLTGYMSNLRIVKGTAIYNPSSSSITVPTSALTAVSGTSLLTLQNSSIVDNSGNSISITNTGSVSTSVQYPFTTNIAADYSGNGNNWTPNNISLLAGSTYDSMTDVPTLTSATAANYAVLNPLAAANPVTITNGNLSISCGNGSTYGNTIGTMAIPSSGKYYIEAVCTQNGAQADWGLQSYPLSGTTRVEWYSGTVYYNGTSASAPSISAGEVLGMAIDVTGGYIYLYKNGSLQTTLTYNISGLTLFPFFGTGYSNTIVNYNVNFGQQPWQYAPPSGYVGLNTYNLPDSTIKAGNKVMDATLYTGNGSTQTITNAAGFKPDFVWVKNRTLAYGHGITDSVRGTNKILCTNNTNGDYTVSDEVTSFNANGFSLGAAAGGFTNVNGSNYVGWQLQAGQGTTSTNTNGSITSTVSVNPSAGFSIVTFTGNATAGATVGHGLGVAPKLIIVKCRGTTTNYSVYAKAANGGNGQNGGFYLNTNGAWFSDSGFWNNTSATSTVFTLGSGGDVNANSQPHVAYCWTEVDGFSKFGSYVGNGSSDGSFIYTGFRPKYVMIKMTSSTNPWSIYDTRRDPYNYSFHLLRANVGNEEDAGSGSGVAVDLLSNGFKLRTNWVDINTNNGSYIYMAFAENPFKYSLAR